MFVLTYKTIHRDVVKLCHKQPQFNHCQSFTLSHLSFLKTNIFWCSDFEIVYTIIVLLFGFGVYKKYIFIMPGALSKLSFMFFSNVSLILYFIYRYYCFPDEKECLKDTRCPFRRFTILGPYVFPIFVLQYVCDNISYWISDHTKCITNVMS